MNTVRSQLGFILDGGTPAAWLNNPFFREQRELRQIITIDASKFLWHGLPSANYGTRHEADISVQTEKDILDLLSLSEKANRKLILCASHVKTRRNECSLVKLLSSSCLPYYYFDCSNFCNNLHYNQTKWKLYYLLRMTPLGYRIRRHWFWNKKGIKQPQIAFVASRFIEQSLRLKGMSTHFERVHARDYENYLVHQQIEAPTVQPHTAVFIDQGLTSAFDITVEGHPQLTKYPDYYIEIGHFLEKAKRELGLKNIFLCLHPGNQVQPESVAKILNSPYICVSKGDTYEKLCRAEVAITHSSSAVSLVALKKKKLILIDVPALTNSPAAIGFLKSITDTAQVFGCPIHTMESHRIRPHFCESRWSSYVRCFIKERQTIDDSYFRVLSQLIE